MQTNTQNNGTAPKVFVPSGLFKQIQGKVMSGGARVYYPEGDFVVSWESCKFGKAKFDKKDVSPNAPSYVFFAADHRILESANCKSPSGSPGRVVNYWTGQKGMIPFEANLRNVFHALFNLSDPEIDALGESIVYEDPDTKQRPMLSHAGGPPVTEFDFTINAMVGVEQICTGYVIEVNAYDNGKDQVIPNLRPPKLETLYKHWAPVGQVQRYGLSPAELEQYAAARAEHFAKK